MDLVFGVDFFPMLVVFSVTWIYTTAQVLDVRLADGASPNEGRVEVNIKDDGWNTVCGTSWDMNDVIVLCSELGFTGAQLQTTRSEFGSGSFPIAADSFFCKGKEATLNDCSRRKIVCGGGDNTAGAVCQTQSYLGCYGDDPTNRPLLGENYSDGYNMTINSCISFCSQRQYIYAGLEFGSECYCGSTNANYSALGRYSDADCRHQCTGDSLKTCGGIAKMAVYLIEPDTRATFRPSRSPGNIGGQPTSSRAPPPRQSQPSSTSSIAMETKAVPKSWTDNTTRIIAFILGGLLGLAVVVIFGCLVWNCKLRSRLKESYTVPHTEYTPVSEMVAVNNARPYMTLNERRTDGQGYQCLSVQKKTSPQKSSEAAAPSSPDIDEGVYQEPAIYMDPDGFCNVSFPKKTEDSYPDDLLGGGNEYETLGTS